MGVGLPGGGGGWVGGWGFSEGLYQTGTRFILATQSAWVRFVVKDGQPESKGGMRC
jgi:hypothetical protein